MGRGSGKSTLLAALRREITEQTREEQDLIRAGRNDDDPETRRVAGVLQVELNAWSFADSENLWASLTSDIFEQIAAGGCQRRHEPPSVLQPCDLPAGRQRTEGAWLQVRIRMDR
ncbi:hypothetical protein FHR22_003537 [Sphingopyxis panaciterrae]|uniref:P-loop NTPase fold protein n=1 Tax=Sphingopyxis panaciterrae TaxID=363841 RepID=UPI00141FE0BC|nr:P-loop NTPase fold protein [Sphingopyxis panaciterrae]NIJ38813.1 hypothetical protein [Sphingopyxis panaciterrae]